MTRVVIADDDLDIRDLLVMKLTSAGYEVIASADGEGALAAIRACPTDLAIIDVNMPLLSGLEVRDSVRANQETAELPIVLMSADGRHVDFLDGGPNDADQFIAKPFSPRALLERVATLLDTTVVAI